MKDFLLTKFDFEYANQAQLWGRLLDFYKNPLSSILIHSSKIHTGCGAARCISGSQREESGSVFFFFFLFMVVPAAYGSSQARVELDLHLRPVPQFVAMLDP